MFSQNLSASERFSVCTYGTNTKTYKCIRGQHTGEDTSEVKTVTGMMVPSRPLVVSTETLSNAYKGSGGHLANWRTVGAPQLYQETDLSLDKDKKN